MTYEIAERARRRTRRAMFIAAISIASVLTLVLLLVVWGRSGSPSLPRTDGLAGSSLPLGGSGQTPGGVVPGSGTPSGTAAPSTTGTGAPASTAGPTSPGGGPSTAPPDVTYNTDVAGVALPVSRTAGPFPRDLGGLSFEQSPRGAGFAALHLVVRLDYNVGPGNYLGVMINQLVGDNAGKLRANISNFYKADRERLGVPDGAPLISSSPATYLGYRLDRYSDLGATVTLLIAAKQASGRPSVFGAQVSLLWEAGTWKIIAPINGEWKNAAVKVPSGEGFHAFSERVEGN